MTAGSLMDAKTQPYFEENVGNIMLMEHVNVQVPQRLQMSASILICGISFSPSGGLDASASLILARRFNWTGVLQRNWQQPILRSVI